MQRSFAVKILIFSEIESIRIERVLNKLSIFSSVMKSPDIEHIARRKKVD